MATLWSDIVNAALRNIHVIAPGETASTQEQADSLLAAQQLVGSLSAEGLPIPYLTLNTITSTGAQTYALATRPLKIEAIEVLTPAQNVSKSARVVPVEEWVAWVDKSATGAFAEIAFCDYNNPTSTVYLAPMPKSGNTINMWTYVPLTPPAALTDTVTFPPGYERLFTALLSVELAPQFGAQVDQVLMAIAQSAKAAISGLNNAVLGPPTPVVAIPPQPVAPAPQ